MSVIGADSGLCRDIQTKLANLGLLEPPSDGRYGPVTDWGLRTFCQKAGLSVQAGFTQTAAAALVNADANQLFPVRQDTGLASRIVHGLLRKGYWLARAPNCRNIVYIEGLNLDGTPNDNTPNRFNDLRTVIRIKEDALPEVLGSWEATTEPSLYWTLHPMNRRGVARIAFGQYKAWARGTHHPGAPQAHEALVQVAPVLVYRDLNQDFRREGKPEAGLFGINQHWGYNLPKDDLGRSSAGGLVGRTEQGQREFMEIVKQDARYAANGSYRFQAVVIPASDLS
jgi:hypothetical protein